MEFKHKLVRMLKTLLILLMVLSASSAFAATSGTLLMDSNGNYGIGTTSPLAQLQVGVNPNITAGSFPAVAIKGGLLVDGKIYGDGSALTGVSGAISGLNAGYISRASTSTTIVDSVIYQNGSNIGIGSSSPQEKLDIRGQLRVGGSIFGEGNIYSSTCLLDQGVGCGSTDITLSAGYTAGQTRSIIFSTNNGGAVTERGRITPAGNFGIGTTAPVANLHIGGGATAVPNAMSITGSDLYVKGNIEFDGKIYGDGSALTGVSGAITGLTDACPCGVQSDHHCGFCDLFCGE